MNQELDTLYQYGTKQMPNIEKYECCSTVVTNSTLECINIEPDLWVYSKTIKSQTPKSIGSFKIQSKQVEQSLNEQGFVDDKNYNLLKKGKAYKVKNFVVMPKNIQEGARKQGWRFLMDNEHGREYSQPFNDLVSLKKIDPDIIVRPDFASHMLFDRYDEPLPVGIMFDYINGNISDGQYDIPKLAKYLINKKDVVVHSVDGWSKDKVDLKVKAHNLSDAIANVPYYNNDQGCTKTVYFTWQPDKVTYRRMWKKCLQTKKDYPSTCMHRVIFDLDLLGLRSAGIALFDNYYKSTRY